MYLLNRNSWMKTRTYTKRENTDHIYNSLSLFLSYSTILRIPTRKINRFKCGVKKNLNHLKNWNNRSIATFSCEIWFLSIYKKNKTLYRTFDLISSRCFVKGVMNYSKILRLNIFTIAWNINEFVLYGKSLNFTWVPVFHRNYYLLA